ncbi:MAG: LPXTG cell wall anchor domain-containing protein, partial [Bacillota bacterium]|nr:LPXTG cell wall anchor domain-containing protein [Bacillota bacterium]
EEEVPLDDFPDLEYVDEPMEEVVEIGDEEVPLAEFVIADEEVPLAAAEDTLLAGIPKTGDASLLWMALSGISGLALAVRRRK